MKFFGISDLHLSLTKPFDPENWDEVELYKPMDVFNYQWHQHYRKIYENWHSLVNPGDIVLLPGDISWATRLEEAEYDIGYLGKLPGTIVAIPGNHDYWWQGISKVRKMMPENVQVIQNDHVMVGNIAICGSRGWACPNGYQFDEQDLKIYKRELIRLENSLQSVKEKPYEIVVMMHFMPTNENHDRSDFIDILCHYGVKTVVYGHLHDRAGKYRLPDEAWGIRFHLVSADHVHFSPVIIKEI
ncbi:metallophosphoesterase [Desulforamulus ruminis]|uniref:Metallophosphoesterase n=1 Tax=Desulforamulus ruminis (strain ATCC 23193 / DSM 2154 / NCIMB 8452 / DL) TaxID=696281 RepID=F6DUK3_DESRL|nr:metallophosphoesterase [Desulforamulus ruminis]AEG59070.1 metallophosphoesterase [Desulforamulus ruminis DSM 2154]